MHGLVQILAAQAESMERMYMSSRANQAALDRLTFQMEAVIKVLTSMADNDRMYYRNTDPSARPHLKAV